MHQSRTANTSKMPLHCKLDKASLIAILLTISPLLALSQLPSNATKSYLTDDSYSLYTPWMPSSQGLLVFTFRTTNPNGLLVYMYSNPSLFYFKLSLLNGALVAEIIDPVDFSFSAIIITIEENVNDNENHTVSILLDNINEQFLVTLEGQSPTLVRYSSPFFEDAHIGENGLFFGGAPEIDDRHFVGCLMNIRYSNDSTQTSDLTPMSPLAEVSVTDGCINPCDGVECGAGVCVEHFPMGFCDCRGTQLLGANCTEDPAVHARTFTDGRSYLCYNVTSFRDEETTLSVTLIPPLPLFGTIMTGLSSNGLSNYKLYFDNGLLVYAFSSSTKKMVAVNPSLTYKIDAAVNRTFSTFTVSELSGGETVTVIHDTETQISPPLDSDPRFPSTCLGGVLLEEQNYVGTIENAFVDYYSLTEEGLFDVLEAVQKERLDMIRLGSEHIEFQISHRNAVKIAFDVRVTEDDGGGILVLLHNNNGDEIKMTVFNEDILIQYAQGHVTCMHNFEDKLWHHVELLISSGSTPNITITIDCKFCGTLTESDVGTIEEYLSNPLSCGVGLNSQSPFRGCFQNFLFEYRDREEFRPDMGALTRVGDNFSASGCFACTASQLTMCSGDQCLHRGYQLDGECGAVTNGNDSLTLCSAPPTNATPTTFIPTTATPTTPTPISSDPPENIQQIGIWVGIGVGVFLAIVLILLLLVLLIFALLKGASGRGFYKTYESNEKNTSALHYSASLKQLTSEVVHQTNGQLPSAGSIQANGGHSSKEFYL